MTRFLIFSLTICLLASCSSPSGQGTGTSRSAEPLVKDTVPFAGFWILEQYVKDLQESGSPRQSLTGGETCILIPGHTMERTCMVYGFHDGGADMAVVKNGDKYQLNYFYDDTLR